jgi:muramoyltetrapeptide carboxypeptidase
VLWRLRLNGTLNRVAGLVFGAFTDYRPDRNFPSMEEMIRSRILDWGLEGIPVAFRFPAGHQRENLPILEGSWARLSITPETTTLKMSRR